MGSHESCSWTEKVFFLCVAADENGRRQLGFLGDNYQVIIRSGNGIITGLVGYVVEFQCIGRNFDFEEAVYSRDGTDAESGDSHVDIFDGFALFIDDPSANGEAGDVLRHEAGGHGFAKLADEYHYSGTVSSSDKDLIKARSAHMWYSNVDITSDRAKVKWAKFLADDRYKDEVGMYEGGFTYQYGVWRPFENSIMNDNRGGFNAPSRYAIWYRIHKLAYGNS